MTRNSNTPTTRTDVSVVESPEATAEREAAANAPEVTKADYVPTREDVVAAYVRGDITKRDAEAYVEKMRGIADARLSKAVTAMLAGEDVTGELGEANKDAAEWRKVAVALDTAKRATARPRRSVDDFTGAMLTRGFALLAAYQGIIEGAIQPADLPDDMRAEYVDAMRAKVTDPETGETREIATLFDGIDNEALNAATSPARTFASQRAFATGSVEVHMRHIADGYGRTKRGLPVVVNVGDKFTCSDIAKLATPEYPLATCSAGYVATKVAIDATTGERSSKVPGWEYALVNGAHGFVFVGYGETTETTDTETTDTPSA
jgi:hypothetical protein